jgi:hypothetical protein
MGPRNAPAPLRAEFGTVVDAAVIAVSAVARVLGLLLEALVVCPPPDEQATAPRATVATATAGRGRVRARGVRCDADTRDLRADPVRVGCRAR